MINHLHINLNDRVLMDSVDGDTSETTGSQINGIELTEEETQERAIFANIAEGNEDAFRKLFVLYSPLFSFIIHKVTGDPELIADYLQDAFLKIWLKRDILDKVVHPRKWAMRIVYNICFNHLKHKQVQKKHVDNWVPLCSPVPKQNHVEKELFHRETEQALKGIILHLPPQTQKIYRLSREEGMDIQQIADYLHLSNQTVRNTLCRGLKMMRLLLKERGIIVVISIQVSLLAFAHIFG